MQGAPDSCHIGPLTRAATQEFHDLTAIMSAATSRDFALAMIGRPC